MREEKSYRRRITSRILRETSQQGNLKRALEPNCVGLRSLEFFVGYACFFFFKFFFLRKPKKKRTFWNRWHKLILNLLWSLNSAIGMISLLLTSCKKSFFSPTLCSCWLHRLADWYHWFSSRKIQEPTDFPAEKYKNEIKTPNRKFRRSVKLKVALLLSSNSNQQWTVEEFLVDEWFLKSWKLFNGKGNRWQAKGCGRRRRKPFKGIIRFSLNRDVPTNHGKINKASGDHFLPQKPP